VIWEILLLRYVQWKRKYLQIAYAIEVREKYGSCGCQEKKGSKLLTSVLNVSLGKSQRLSPRDWMRCQSKGRGSIFGVKYDVGGKTHGSLFGVEYSQLVSRVRRPLVTLLARRYTYHDLGKWSDSDHYNKNLYLSIKMHSRPLKFTIRTSIVIPLILKLSNELKIVCKSSK